MKRLKIIIAVLIITFVSCNTNNDKEGANPEQSKEFMELQKKKTDKQKELEKLKEEIKRLKSQKDSLESSSDTLK